MSPEIVDLIYAENIEVKGIAVAKADGKIIDNHLVIPDPSIKKIAKRFCELRKSLSGSGRNMKGFVVRTPEGLLQVCFLRNFIVFVSLLEGQESSLCKVDKSIRAIIEEKEASLSLELAVAENNSSSVDSTGGEKDVSTAEGYNLSEFVTKLTALLKLHSPSQDFTETLTQSVMALELADSNTVTPKEAIALANRVIEKIPNIKERKAASADFVVIAKWLVL